MGSDELTVEVAYSPRAGEVDLVALKVPRGSTALTAIEVSGLLKRHPALSEGALSIGIWGKARESSHPLCEGDRVEVYRPLLVDPKEARRQRYQRHRARAAR